jgi:hypothetical protein
MRNFFFLLLLIFVLLFSCKKEPQEVYNGVITGYDMRKCACCGGIFIDIDKTSYRFDSLPPKSGIDFTTDTFPIRVVVTWHKKDIQCIGDEIIIDKIRK